MLKAEEVANRNNTRITKATRAARFPHLVSGRYKWDPRLHPPGSGLPEAVAG